MVFHKFVKLMWFKIIKFKNQKILKLVAYLQFFMRAYDSVIVFCEYYIILIIFKVKYDLK